MLRLTNSLAKFYIIGIKAEKKANIKTPPRQGNIHNLMNEAMLSPTLLKETDPSDEHNLNGIMPFFTPTESGGVSCVGFLFET